MRALVFGAMLGLALSAAAPGQAQAPCDRACLAELTERTIGALVSGETARAPFADGVKVTENGRPAPLRHTSLRRVQALTYRHAFAAPANGQAGFYGFASEKDGGASIFALRIKVQARRITEVEAVTTRKGEASIFAPHALAAPKPSWDAVVPQARRTPPGRMIAAANAYFDGIEAADGAKVPAAPGCNRYENGGQTTNRPGRPPGGCKQLSGFGYIETVRDRRFPIVDQERGLVWGIAVFDIPGGVYTVVENGQPREIRREPRSILLGELFKIEAGQIRDIEVVMRNLPLGAASGWN